MLDVNLDLGRHCNTPWSAVGWSPWLDRGRKGWVHGDDGKVVKDEIFTRTVPLNKTTKTNNKNFSLGPSKGPSGNTD